MKKIFKVYDLQKNGEIIIPNAILVYRDSFDTEEEAIEFVNKCINNGVDELVILPVYIKVY